MAADMGRLYFLVAILFLNSVLIVDAACPSGRFGNDCRSECHCSTGGPCNEVTGSCNDGCATGYSGDNCQLSNIALNKPAIQSSTHGDALASRAVDGNRSPRWDKGSCTHTSAGGSNPWWRVDLQAEYAVYEVNIQNRGDCCGQRLHDVDIRISNQSTPCNQDCDDQHCKFRAGPFSNGESVDFTCDNIVYGQYLYVSIRSTSGRTDVLTLCEVEVKGRYHKLCEDFIGGPTFLDNMTMPGNHMNIYPRLSIAANGVLVGWKFNAGRSGTVWFDIWRPTVPTNTWQLVNKTQVTASYTGEQLLMLPLNERFSVQAGDLIGYHYNASMQTVVRAKTFDDGSSCCAGVNLQDYNPVHGQGRYDDTLSIGISITGTVDNSGGRAPALQAVVVSDETLSLTNLALTTESQGASIYAKITVTWNAPSPTSCINNYVVSHKQFNAAWTDSDLYPTVPTVVLYGLTGFTSYDVRVAAVSKRYDLISEPITANITTPTTEPSSAPVNFQHTSRTYSTLVLTWEEPIHPRGIITNYRVFCQPVNSTLVNSTTEVPSSSNAIMKDVKSSNDLSVLIESLRSATQFNCGVSAHTSIGYGDVATHMTWTGPSKLTESDLSTIESVVDQASVTGTTITMMLKPYKSSDGIDVSEYRVVVDKQGNNRRKRASFDETKEKQLYGHDEAIDKGLSHYITANFIPSDILNDGIEFIVGDGKMYGGYTNEPLEEGSTYDLWYGILRSVDGVTTASYAFVATQKTTAAEPNVTPPAKSAVDNDVGGNMGGNIPAIAGGVAAAIIVLVIVVIVLLVVIRRRRRQPDYNNHNTTALTYDSEDETLHTTKFENDTRLTQQEDTNEEDNEDAEEGLTNITDNFVEENIYDNFKKESGRIRSSEFPKYVLDTKERQGKESFKVEFLTLPQDLMSPHDVGSTPVYAVKNRYRNIVPYDLNRVELKPLPGDPESHYVNASYVDGYHSPKQYIASQGPNKFTLDDFVRMLWQVNTNCIVMLTGLVESGKRKCEPYWPSAVNDVSVFGGIIVTLTHEEVLPEYTLRTLSLQFEKELKSITQLHFTVWPDHGAPKMATSLLNFRRKVGMYESKNDAPTVVHCSAGVGRTGTFIALNYLLEQHKAEGYVDTYGCVQHLRFQRVNMIQSIEQYVHLHEAVAEAIRCGETAIPCSVAPMKIKAMLKVNPRTKRSTVQDQFETLLEVQALYPVAEDKSPTGLESSNVDKNRDKSIIPQNINRPILMTPIKGHGNYINATFVDGYRKKEEFIMTQMPLPHTQTDFWRMLYDLDSSTVVMLNELDKNDESCKRYWPEKQETYDVFRVDFKEIETSTPTFVIRDFKLQNVNRPNEEPRIVRHFQLMTWPKDQEFPSDKYDLVTLMEHVERWQQKMGNPRITVHCMNGAERSGLYLALMGMCGKIQLEQEVDVFQSVKLVRMSRPQSVHSLEQYKFLYQIALQYMESFETYANFK